MSKFLTTHKEANQVLRRLRRIRASIARHEEAAESKIETVRDNLVRQTASLCSAEEALLSDLHDFYNRMKRDGEKSIKLQDGTIGVRATPRVVVPKSAAEHPDLPEEAMSIRVRVNKTALAAMGEDTMAKVGAKIVRPIRFYAKTADEDAAR